MARRFAATALILAVSADAFSISLFRLTPAPPSSSLRALVPVQGPGRRRGARNGGLRMQQEDDFSEESMNRDQRRRMKKAKNRRQTPTSQAEKLNAASAVMADTIAGRETPQKVAQPKALEELRKQAQDGREDAIKQLAEMRRGRAAQPPEEAPLVQQMRKVDDSTLFAVENALYYAAITAGALWVVAGLCVAADAFLIATKRPVPPAFDDMLGKYVEPFLTPGLVAVLVFSLALGALQFIKFESGPTSTGKGKPVKKQGGGGGPLG